MTEAQRQIRHELRTPVNHILSYARLVREEADELRLGEAAPRLAAIQAAGQRALILIDALLERSAPAASAELSGLAGQIAEQAEQLRAAAARAGRAQVAEDVGRIAEAARRLLALAGEAEARMRPSGEARPDAPDHEARPASPVPGGKLPAHAVLPDGADQPSMPPTPGSAGPTRPVETGQPGSRVEAGRTPPASILVVDDNEANRDVLSRSLARLGYEVRCAENGRAALDVLTSADVDLVLLDIMMPELDGYAVLAHRRADPRLRSIPFIVISATGDDASVIPCIEMGAEDYLPKPFDPVLLRARIGACLEKKQLHDQEQRHLATIAAQAAALAEWSRTLERRVAEQVARLERLSGLKRFLPPQLAETIVATGDEALLDSHRRQIAVVFCDLRGYTQFSETAEPEEVMDVLRQYHAAMGALIARYEGTVEHFAGDGLMVLFNDPLPCPEPERRAVCMAIEMREQMARLAERWRRFGHALGFGVGITAGYATLGRIGFEGRLHYAAIGSVVNLAARLCGEAADGQILASRRVGLAVDGVAVVRPVGDLHLKGFRDAVPVVEIVGAR